jgi:hypothetical protein
MSIDGVSSKPKYSELSDFTKGNLTASISIVESSISGLGRDGCDAFLAKYHATPDALEAAYEIKKLAGQVNVSIHALGILACLPHILLDDERVESVSLGAGNTGRKFDLETNLRIAEFKFINWRGGAESIRQNSIFKDFFELAEEDTEKQKHLYLLGTNHAMKFFNGGRALDSVLSKNEATRLRFQELYGDQYTTVREYFESHNEKVVIEDVGHWVPQLLT